jgi:glutamate racemase
MKLDLPAVASLSQSEKSALGSKGNPRIGVFDSGVGGLSVLRAIEQALPEANLHYFADSGHAPYGERDDTYVLERSKHIAAHLIAAGNEVLVIACNTATAVAAEALRQTWPHIPIVGVEPGIKPGVLASKNHRVGVMATSGTLKSQRFQRLLALHGQGTHIVTQACTGLALAIESGDLQSPQILELVQRHCAPLRQAGVDTVVLGCTHYAFARIAIEEALGPGVQVVDTAEAVARETRRRVREHVALASSSDAAIPATAAPALQLESSGDVGTLVQITQRWLPLQRLQLASAQPP